jgi:ABC-type transport system involved in cytochrome c biogenesis permease component
MDDTDAQKRVVFTAAIVSGIAYGVLAAIYVANSGVPRGTILLAIVGLCIVLPIIGLAIRSVFPRVRDYATGVMLSPFAGAITYLAMMFVMAIA